MLACSERDPIGNERTDRVKHLPEGHDLSTDLRGRKFSDVDGTSSEGKTLADTDDDTASDESTNLSTRSKCLHNSRDDD